MAQPVQVELSWRNYANLAAYGLSAAVVWLSSENIAILPLAPQVELSAKYQTLINPDAFTFLIWIFIYLGELIFTVAQMLPRYRDSKVVHAVTPGWVMACVAQTSWTICFGLELLPLSLAFMCLILVCLLWVVASTDSLVMTWEEFVVLRWSFSLHFGWIVCATALLFNTTADFQKASPQVLLGTAVTTVGALSIVLTMIALVKAKPEPIVCLVGAWAFYGISSELSDPTHELINSPDRHNPYTWDLVTLGGLRIAASNIVWVCLALAAVAVARALWLGWRAGGDTLKSGEHTQELVESSAQAA